MCAAAFQLLLCFRFLVRRKSNARRQPSVQTGGRGPATIRGCTSTDLYKTEQGTGVKAQSSSGPRLHSHQHQAAPSAKQLWVCRAATTASARLRAMAKRRPKPGAAADSQSPQGSIAPSTRPVWCRRFSGLRLACELTANSRHLIVSLSLSKSRRPFLR